MKRVYRGLKRYGHEALRNHVLETAHRARSRHPALDSKDALQAMLHDGDVVRFRTELVFDAGLEPGYFGEPRATSDEDGARVFELAVHPHFADRPADLAVLVPYFVPSINYGRMASSEDAEAFGATLLGIPTDDYYARVCALADELAGAPA